MNRVCLDNVDEPIKDFVLSLSAAGEGSVLEFNGQVVACLVPGSMTNGSASNQEWSDAKNSQRVALINKKHASGLTPAEAIELAQLQEAMLRYRQKVAPLPLEDARRLHQELLSRAGQQPLSP